MLTDREKHAPQMKLQFSMVLKDGQLKPFSWRKDAIRLKKRILQQRNARSGQLLTRPNLLTWWEGMIQKQEKIRLLNMVKDRGTKELIELLQGASSPPLMSLSSADDESSFDLFEILLSSLIWSVVDSSFTVGMMKWFSFTVKLTPYLVLMVVKLLFVFCLSSTIDTLTTPWQHLDNTLTPLMSKIGKFQS